MIQSRSDGTAPSVYIAFCEDLEERWGHFLLTRCIFWYLLHFTTQPVRSVASILQMKKPRFIEVWGQVPKATEVHPAFLYDLSG